MDRWRLLPGVCRPPYLGVLIGEITGHPSVRDGWTSTSPVVSIDREAKRARTRSRWYRLGEELPATEPLPPEARKGLVARYLRERGGATTPDDIVEIAAIVAALSKPLGQGSA
jgi:hypothetical protein